MSAVLFAMYFLSACLVSFIMARSIKRSAFGVLIASALVWFLIGGCLYPLFHLFGAVDNNGEVADFISRNGEPGLSAAIHILLMASGMFCGYVFRSRFGISDSSARWVTKRMIDANDALVWRCSILLGIVSYLVYFKLVGFDVALMNAAAARSGDYEGFGENDAYVFIKTVAAIGFVAASFVPAALFDKNRLFIVAYILLVATAYANSISRNLILYSVIVPVVVYLRLKFDIGKRKNRMSSLIVGLALIPFAFLVLNYGKIMGHYIKAYFTGDYYSLAEEGGVDSIVSVILENFGFQWASVQAGIDHFAQTGAPLFTSEHVLALFFGAVPSRVLAFFGLDFLYYGTVKPSLACINSAAFGYIECNVPPLAIGYSAYLLPGVGGFLIGFIWLRVFSAIEKVWLTLQKGNWRKLWIPFFMWGIVVNVFTFIPATLALTAAEVLWVTVLSRLRMAPVLPRRTRSRRVASAVPTSQSIAYPLWLTEKEK